MCVYNKLGENIFIIMKGGIYMYEAYNKDKAGSYCISEQGDLGLGLTPITESDNDADEDEKEED